MDNVLLMLDLDQTLLTDSGEVSDFTRTMLDKCRELDWKIVISTLRSNTRVLKFHDLIKPDIISCFSGNYILDLNGNVIKDRSLSSFEVRDITEKIESKFVSVHISGGEDLIGGYATTEDFAKIKNLEFKSKEDLCEHSLYKVFFKLKNADDVKIIESFVINNGYDFKLSNYENYFRVMPKNTDKWFALGTIAKQLNLDHFKTIVFGNDMNDALSLEKSDIGVKMLNSTIALMQNKNIEFTTTLSNNEDGVAWFLYNLLSN